MVTLQRKWADASEVFYVILQCLHMAFESRSDASDDVGSEFSARTGSGECDTNCTCAFFGMDVSRRLKCDKCKLESTLEEHPSNFHHITASNLRKEKVCHD